MMKKLDRRGVAALEFCLIAAPLFITMFAIFDFGRYAITMQSLRALADAGARAVMINCYTNDIVKNLPLSNCTGDAIPAVADKEAVAPFGGNTATLTVTCASAGSACTASATPATNHGSLTVTASQPGFTMLMPIFGTSLNAPTTTTTVPF